MKLKFKNLPQAEQEGYVLNYISHAHLKAYLLCYEDISLAIEKLQEDKQDFFCIECTITHWVDGEKIEEELKANAKDVIPVLKKLLEENRFFSSKGDYKSLFEMAEYESRTLSYTPKEFITDDLVDHFIDKNKSPYIDSIPQEFITVERFCKIAEKCYSMEHHLPEHIHLFSERDLFNLLTVKNGQRFAMTVKDRWTKNLLYKYLEHCVHSNIDPGFSDFRTRVPEELQDRVYHQCCCMLGGFYYSRIPHEMKSIVISKRLIAETIRRWDIHHQSNSSSFYWNGLSWMLQYLPEEFVTLEVCIEVCKRYPYAIGHVPDEFLKLDSFWEPVLTEGSIENLISLDDKKAKLLPKKYQSLRANELREKRLREPASKPAKKDDWAEIVKRNGARIYDVPKDMVTLDLALSAMKSNAFFVSKNFSFLDNLTEDDKNTFFKTIVAENLFYTPISVPDEYMSEEKVLSWAEQTSSYEVANVSEKFRTHSVLMKIATTHPDRFTFPFEVQSQELIDTLMDLQEKDIHRALIMKKVRPDLRRKELVDKLCISNPCEMLSLDSISKDQIESILSEYPHLIIKAPYWYLFDLRNGGTKEKVEAVAVEKEETGNVFDVAITIPSVENEPIEDLISNSEWSQLSIFDFLV